MARQPFLPKYTGQQFSINPGVAHQQPEMLELIAKCIILWPFIEHQMAVSLGLLLGSNTEASLAVFSSLRNGRAQRDAIQAAADVRLNQNGQDLVAACLSAFRTAEKIRNDLAHGQWGVLHDNPKDTLVWVEDKHHAPWFTAVKVAGGEGEAPPRSDLEKNVFVYTKDDLIAHQNTLGDVLQIGMKLNMWLDPNLAERDPVFDELSAQPLVRQALDHLHEQRSKSSTPPR